VEVPVVDPLAPEMLRPHLERGGVPAIKAHLAAMAGSFKPQQLAVACLSLGKAVSKSAGPDTDFALAELALELDRSELVLRGFFWAAQRTLRLEAAFSAFSEFESLGQRHPSPTHAGYLEKLGRSPIVQLGLLNLVAEQKVDSIEAVPRRVCYVLHNSLPYSSGGYATRAHGVCGGLSEAGYEVIVLTRPGFPLDTKPELTAADVAPQDVVDGIRFVRTLEPQRSTGVPIVPYVRAAALAMEGRLREWRPEIVVAASNYRTALPALIAARRLGIPFVYEVRGFWEVTRLSREPEYANTVAFATQSLLESRVAQLSDRVFTLTEPMREELVLRGVPAAKVDLLPNSCDPSRFVPRQRDLALASKLGIPNGVTVIGYVGTFVDYEGLEDLALACANLKAQGQVFRLLLVGNENASGANRGPISEEILRIAHSEGLAEWLIMPGRVPHEEVEAYYSLIDIAAFPRKPWPVCEMVSPMKPLEALATGKAVLVSSVRALTEIIADGKTGRVFEKGNIASMTDKLAQLIADPGLRGELGRTGREWVIRERTWTRIGQTLAQCFDVLAKRSTERAPEQQDSIQRSASKPRWWNKIDASFRERCDYVDVASFKPRADVAKLRSAYVEKFGEEAVARRMPAANWARADICARIVTPGESLLDIGSGLGEFVNLIALRRSHGAITSVDRKDYDLWMDASGELQRVYKDLFKLDATHARNVVTCFEVIEHLPPDKVELAVRHLRSLAKQRLYVSVPFMEPLPLYKGHFTRFDHVNLSALFPDARMTVFGKANDDEVRAWILCEVDTSKPGAEHVVSK
jgi:glycosyltransferase involved in cell wall biosynthesis